VNAFRDRVVREDQVAEDSGIVEQAPSRGVPRDTAQMRDDLAFPQRVTSFAIWSRRPLTKATSFLS
jgi:hypothetical protein